VRRFLFQTIHDVALTLDRERVGRAASPTGGVIDSQSVKAPEARTRGYVTGKKIVGRKRHIAVDTDGRLLMVNLTTADISEGLFDSSSRGECPLFALTGRLESLRVSDAGPAQKRRRGLKGRRLKASEGGNRGPLRWRRRGGWGYGDLRAGRSVERGSRPAWSAWSGMFEAICEGGSREEAHATDRRKTVLAAADDGGVSGNMPPRPLGES